ncbi:hypothetical protein C8R47DRAFT_1169565 [Mycena vitilis]|nr:hypothetical protein C8R47DRAFT_1169565 [Mycena vitilis]
MPPTSYTPLENHAVVGIDTVSAAGEGSVKLQFRVGSKLTTVTLARVLYLPSSPHNLISLGRLHRAGYELEFPFDSTDIIIHRNGSRLAHCRNIGDVYALGNVMPVRGNAHNDDEYKYQPAVPTDPTQRQGEHNPVNGAPILDKAHSTPSSPARINAQTPGSPLTPISSPTPSSEPSPPRKAPRDINLDPYSQDNIVLGPRTRKYVKPGHSFVAILEDHTAASETSHGGKFTTAHDAAASAKLGSTRV